MVHVGKLPGPWSGRLRHLLCFLTVTGPIGHKSLCSWTCAAFKTNVCINSFLHASLLTFNFPSRLHKYFPDLSSSPPGPYGQEMYVFRSEERFKSPPILPPHLLQVILNKDTNISVSILNRLLEYLGISRTWRPNFSSLGAGILTQMWQGRKLCACREHCGILFPGLNWDFCRYQ